MSKLSKEQVEHLEKNIRNIEYGTISITIHDGRITQIDSTEKKRFSPTVQRA
ncbi:MAG TPA: YezD family protein [Pseudogracilibacillus sp.]|nr:YezD family protein [Pseudogracilibacillus sp.]